MTKLLKDMPEHMELIEGNYLLGKELEDIIEQSEFAEDWDSEMKSDMVYISMTSHNGGAVLREADGNDTENLVLIMPCVL